MRPFHPLPRPPSVGPSRLTSRAPRRPVARYAALRERYKGKEIEGGNDFVQVYEDQRGEWRWRRRDARNGRIVADSGEGYHDRTYAVLAAQEYNPGLPLHPGYGTKALPQHVTGERRDRLGRRRCYDDGKLVPCGDPDRPGEQLSGREGGGEGEGTPRQRQDRQERLPHPDRRSPRGTEEERKARRDAFWRSPAGRFLVEQGTMREAELAEATGMFNYGDSEPADCVLAVLPDGTPAATAEAVGELMKAREAAVGVLRATDATPEQRQTAEQVLARPFVFVEVKTMLTNKRGKVRLTAGALGRKRDWGERYQASWHVVIFDERKGERHSGHRVYHSPGLAGLFDVSTMRKVSSPADVLNLLK